MCPHVACRFMCLYSSWRAPLAGIIYDAWFCVDIAKASQSEINTHVAEVIARVLAK